MAAAVLLSAVGLRAVQTRSYRKFRRSAKKRGVIFQSIYGLGELLQAFGLSFSSPALRYTVVTAAVVTYTARGLGASLGLPFGRWVPPGGPGECPNGSFSSTPFSSHRGGENRERNQKRRTKKKRKSFSNKAISQRITTL